MRGEKKNGAFLIIAHQDLFLLERLLRMLDSPDHDIYLHVDKKWRDFPFQRAAACVRASALYFVPRRKVYWGTDSQILCELSLLEQALEGNYRYYHLISGTDLPLKTPAEMDAVLEARGGGEFIEYQEGGAADSGFLHKIRYYHVFGSRIGKASDRSGRLFRFLDHALYLGQRRLGIDRVGKDAGTYWKGSNWFSITHGLAAYLVDRKALIRRRFRFTLCGDEIFAQTLAKQSPFAGRIANDCLRLIVWDREKDEPVTFRMEDYGLLSSSAALFARKFSSLADQAVIEALYRDIMERKRREEEREDG